MAAPIVAGVAAMARELNPDATAGDIIRVLKETATRPAGSGWNAELGLGDPRRRRGGGRRARDRPPRARVQAHRAHARAQARSVTLQLDRRGRRAGRPDALRRRRLRGLPLRQPAAPTGASSARASASLKVAVKPGSRYRFYTVAVDKAGNREAAPAKPDLSMRVDRRG